MTRHVITAVAAFVLVAGSLAAVADSHVRIVRLSSVEGQVQMDRAAGAGLEKAILNTPIVEGTRLATGSDGLAEIEFENQSALRLTEDSEVKFSKLLMNDAGMKIDQIEVVRGLVYLDAASKGDDVYRLMVGSNSFLVRRDTEMRLSAGADQIQVAVFKGEVQLENQPQPVTIGKKETLTLAGNSGKNYTVAKGVEPVRFDAWNKEREAYSNTYAENQGYGGPGRAYGLQDLNYYGNYFYAGGYGYVWQPFGFANAMMSWSPYNNGAWMFYPGMGMRGPRLIRGAGCHFTMAHGRLSMARDGLGCRAAITVASGTRPASRACLALAERPQAGRQLLLRPLRQRRTLPGRRCWWARLVPIRSPFREDGFRQALPA